MLIILSIPSFTNYNQKQITIPECGITTGKLAVKAGSSSNLEVEHAYFVSDKSGIPVIIHWYFSLYPQVCTSSIKLGFFYLIFCL